MGDTWLGTRLGTRRGRLAPLGLLLLAASLLGLAGWARSALHGRSAPDCGHTSSDGTAPAGAFFVGEIVFTSGSPVGLVSDPKAGRLYLTTVPYPPDAAASGTLITIDARSGCVLAERPTSPLAGPGMPQGAGGRVADPRTGHTILAYPAPHDCGLGGGTIEEHQSRGGRLLWTEHAVSVCDAMGVVLDSSMGRAFVLAPLGGAVSLDVRHAILGELWVLDTAR